MLHYQLILSMKDFLWYKERDQLNLRVDKEKKQLMF